MTDMAQDEMSSGRVQAPASRFISASWNADRAHAFHDPTEHQGLTLVHCSAQREHFVCHVVGCFAGFSD